MMFPWGFIVPKAGSCDGFQQKGGFMKRSRFVPALGFRSGSLGLMALVAGKAGGAVARRCAALVVWSLLGEALPGLEPQVAPLNPEFVALHQAGLKEVESGEVNYGLLPSPVDLSHLRAQEFPPQPRSLLALAPACDLRALGRVTPVRNQGPYGTCWAFATFASMESHLLPDEARDFSENHLVNMDGFDAAFQTGGNFFMSMAYLAGWRGPVAEADDPYPNPSGSPAGLPAWRHARQMRIIPGKAGPTANDLIKSAVMDDGAVFASYYHHNSYWNATFNSYRYSGSRSGNHAVAIVGWDDEFDRNKFSSVPPGNGAYLVKNSWGESWGGGGYFHVSYHDARLGYEPMCAFHSAETPDDFSSIHEYDPLGWVANLGIGTTTFWGANLFTAAANGELGAVGFYANSLNTGYEIQVYTGVAAGLPTSGTLASIQTGTCPYPGYRTISLDAPAALEEGQRFAIVLKLTTPGYNYPLPIEYAISGYSSAARGAAGQSFYSADGGAWFDLWNWNATANFCIKGYTVMHGSPEIAIEQPPDADLADGDGMVEFDAVAIGGGTSTRVFIIRNSGPRYLKGVRVSIDGDDSADFVPDAVGVDTILASGACANFSVTFVPAGTVSGLRRAALHVSSNDEDENPFDVALGGQAFSSIADMDGDGMCDWAEYRCAVLGFDWTVSQPVLVTTLYENANLAGLFTEAQVRSLHVGTPMLARDPETGRFKLTIGIRKSNDLTQWSDFPFTSPGTTINGEGRLEFDFTVPDKTAFFRLESR